MDKVAILAVVVNQNTQENVDKLNRLLHDFRSIIIGRMGLPYPERNLSLISLMVDGKEDDINALSGKLGMIPHVHVKTAYANTNA